jgi:hypothetical protein
LASSAAQFDLILGLLLVETLFGARLDLCASLGDIVQALLRRTNWSGIDIPSESK